MRFLHLCVSGQVLNGCKLAQLQRNKLSDSEGVASTICVF